MVKNVQEIFATLHLFQRARLTSLFGSRHALPWEDGNDELTGLHLVHIRRLKHGGETTELNNRGWSVTMLINDEDGD